MPRRVWAGAEASANSPAASARPGDAHRAIPWTRGSIVLRYDPGPLPVPPGRASGYDQGLPAWESGLRLGMAVQGQFWLHRPGNDRGGPLKTTVWEWFMGENNNESIILILF
jgi:hypothetical protein